MQFNSTNDQIEERFQNACTTAIRGFLGGIDQSDVPFVYHHLRKGCILHLSSIVSGNRHLMFAVNYGSYRVGTLNSSMARKIQELQLHGKVFRLTIAQVVKEKYMPPTAIVVDLECDNSYLAEVA